MNSQSLTRNGFNQLLPEMINSSPMIDSLHNRHFITLENSEGGEVSSETVFHYRQEGEVIWATYEGGEVRFGTLLGLRAGDSLTFRYQHINSKGQLLSGECNSILKLQDGKIHSFEEWQWTNGNNGTGTSVLREI